MENNMVEVTVDIKKETPQAFLVTDGDIEAWIPKSQINRLTRVAYNNTTVIEIPEWLAEDRELI